MKTKLPGTYEFYVPRYTERRRHERGGNVRVLISQQDVGLLDLCDIWVARGNLGHTVVIQPHGYNDLHVRPTYARPEHHLGYLICKRYAQEKNIDMPVTFCLKSSTTVCDYRRGAFYSFDTLPAPSGYITYSVEL